MVRGRQGAGCGRRVSGGGREADCSGKVDEGGVDGSVGGFDVRADDGSAEGLEVELFAGDPASDNTALASEGPSDRADVAGMVGEQ